MIINRSKVIEAIIKDVSENFDNYTQLSYHDYDVVRI